MTSNKLKISFIWNVWNTYEDVLLGSEIIIQENKRLDIFADINSVSLGGYDTLPTAKESQYSTHLHIEFPKIQLTLNGHAKFKGIFRVFEGIKKAYELAASRGDDYALVTNADAWYLDMHKLHAILNDERTKNACVSCRIGTLTSLRSNASLRMPMTDDHFIILNIKECKKHNVFAYDNDVQFYHTLLGHVGSMHNLFYQFLTTRVPENKLFIYSDLSRAIGQYGDKIGWNLLPWQLDQEFMFLHANCSQKNELHYLRAELMRSLSFDQFKNMKEYCERYPRKKSPYIMKKENGLPVRKRTLNRLIHDKLFFFLRKLSARINFTLSRNPGEKISPEHRLNSNIFPTDFLN